MNHRGNDRIKVLLDTDIGSDIDDALALAYLLAQPRCELVGVTTVTGETTQRAALAGKICDLAGRDDVPIHCGSPGPLAFGPGQPNVPQYEAITAEPHRLDFPDEHAVSFLRRTIRENPGEIVLLTVGPLTNAAVLFGLDPEIPSLLRSMVLMAGAYTDAMRDERGKLRAEWNLRCDPVASSIVYHARPRQFTAYGLDVTTQCVLSAGEYRQRFGDAGPAMQAVNAMAEVWFREHNRMTFHDPLAAASIFEPELCEYAAGEAEICLRADSRFGASPFHPAADNPPHRIAAGVDSQRFFDHFTEVIGRLAR